MTDVSTLMTLAVAAAEAGNPQEAYAYYTRVVEREPTNSEAWFGKAVAAGKCSSLRRDRLDELLAGLTKAIDLAPPETQPALHARAAAAILSVAEPYYDLSLTHFEKFASVDGAWTDHTLRCNKLIGALTLAAEYDQKNAQAIDLGITICTELLKGVNYEHHGEWKSHELPVEANVIFDRMRDKLIEKKRALDPNYVAPSTTSATSCGCAIVSLAFVLAVAYGVFYALTH